MLKCTEFNTVGEWNAQVEAHKRGKREGKCAKHVGLYCRMMPRAALRLDAISAYSTSGERG